MSSLDIEIDIDCSMNSVVERSASAPSSPNERSSVLRDIASLGGCAGSRRVTFPEDETIVTGYFEAPDPWGEDVSTDNIVAAYRAACWKQGVKPLQRVLQQLQAVTLNADLEFELNLKGENLDAQHCEALEEIFKRLQFRSLLLEDSNLNDEGAAALFDMIEYYDTTSHLNIAANKSIGNQGWQACCKMLKRTPCLQTLDASRTSQNEQSLLIMGRAFRTGTHLATLRLEECGITGRSLVILVAALKLNNTLLELFLSDNKICSADGLQLGNLLRANSTLELLDLRTNNLQDLGVCHLVDGLCQQAASSGEGLRTLNLASNSLTRNGMAHINRALLVSESLCSLDVGGNCVCDEGIQQMKQGLLTNQSMEELRLTHAKITCEGAVALAEFIADNQHIGSVDLRGNEIRLAGLMALSLSLQHSQSVTSLRLDAPPPSDCMQRGSDVKSNEQKLLGDIQEYCKRNRKKIDSEKEVDFVVQNANNVPIIRSEAELTALIQEKASQLTDSNASGDAASRNRFQVCRVFLDAEEEVDSTFPHPSPIESGYDSSSGGTPPADTRRPIRHQDSLALHKHKQHGGSAGSEAAEADCFCYTRYIHSEDTDAGGRDEVIRVDGDTEQIAGKPTGLLGRRSSGSSGKKKLSFVLPQDHAEHNDEAAKQQRLKNNRRMSTPAVATQRLVQRQRQTSGNMRLGRQLEGLDLRSSVPLSPTRLREGLLFPDPFNGKGNEVSIQPC